jgi:hypothetical protein
MAILTGAIKYRGSFKSIRNYVTLHDPNVYAGEKGGANRDLIMNNAAFARTRENMTEFNGCGMAVKAIRLGLMNLLPEQTDRYFTGRLMKVVKEINRRDDVGLRGKRSIFFSADRIFLSTMVLNTLENTSFLNKKQYAFEHPITRAEATLTLTGLNIKPVYVPKGATHFRVQNHLSIIADYTYSEVNRRYEPLSTLNEMSEYSYSEYTSVKASLTDDLVTAFPVGTTLTDEVSVIQCVGIEFFQLNGTNVYSPLKGSYMKVVEVF